MDDPSDFRERAKICRDMAAKGGAESEALLRAAATWEDIARRTELLLGFMKPETSLDS